MSKEIINEETGEKEIFYTQAELDTQLKDKDEHVEQKLKEFQQGKTAQELKDIERDEQIKTARETADKAIETANSTVATARKNVVDYMAAQIVGEDKELRTKLDEAIEIIEAGRIAKGMDIKDEKSIREIMISAASMSGISTVAPVSPVFPMTGGVPPSFNKTPGQISNEEHNMFLQATGQEIPKPPVA